ncbi:MAG TPA: class II aldolase/adducin family protein, partial [Anaerolineae bacterium]|nr:class II aldolase/adducin family protein [Anaerolineae bacterium]
MGGAPTERELREEIVHVCRLMYERGYIVATEGNVSARLSEDRLLVTPSGLCKGLLSPDQLIVVDMGGRRIGPGPRPTTEMAMHLEAYRRRPDIGAVVHAHPPVALALSIAGLPLADRLLPEVIVTLGSIPTTEYATPSTAEGAEAIKGLIRDHDAL